MTRELSIPVLHRKLGVTEINDRMAQRIEDGLADPDCRLPEIIGALINVHKGDINDAREIRHKFRHMEISVKRTSSKIKLKLKNVPTDCLYDGENVIWAAVEHITSALRDTVFSPKKPAENCTHGECSRYVKRFSENASLLYRGERGLVVFIWGGHRVNREEYEFAKQVAYWLALALPDMENITGCGAGIMKAPFKGAQVAYAKQRAWERFGPRDFIGLTEKNILAAEPPNELVNRVVIYPNIEQRMEAFIRASHRGRAHPGGAGTLEEVLTMLAVLAHPDNKGMVYPFDLVEHEGGQYFLSIIGFLRTCFGTDLDPFYTLHLGSPSTYAKHVVETTSELPMRYLWNDDIVVDKTLQESPPVTFESMEALDLSRNQPKDMLLVNLRRFFSSIVHLSVKDPDLLDSWGDERPLLKGDPDILAAVDHLMRDLEAQGRIHPNPNYSRPYRIA